MKKSEMLFGLAKIPLDAGMAFLAFMGAYRLRHYTDLIPGVHFQPIGPERMRVRENLGNLVRCGVPQDHSRLDVFRLPGL